MIKDSSEFLRTALKSYDNPQCITVDEFNEDLRRFTSIRKQLIAYKEGRQDLNIRSVLNSCVICFNLFGLDALDLFLFKIERDHWDVLFPFLIQLNQLPEHLEGVELDTVDLNKDIIDKLRGV